MTQSRDRAKSDAIDEEEEPIEKPADKHGKASARGGSQRVLKKYPNRRLYDTHTSSYITLVDVKQMVLGNEDFVVRDAKTNDDLTRSILLQIILDEETAGAPIFSAPMLAQMIRFYGHAMQGLMGNYLEKNMQAFVELQKRFTEGAGGVGVYDAKPPIGPESWTQLMGLQAPMVQNMMTSYLEQSKNLFVQMQEQMQKQAEQAASLFPAAGFGAGNRNNS
jgi:polyhydroxyalkanoate synthesis repressor PhaR